MTNNKVNDEIGRLVFDGVATVRTIEDLHSKLLEMMQQHAIIEIDCAGVSEVDLSFIQLLLSARKSARENGKSFGLAHPASGALHDALTSGGFMVAVEGIRNEDMAFWRKGTIVK